MLAALSLDFDDRRSAGDVEAAVSRIEREIKAAFPEVTRVFVEAKDRNAPSQTETRTSLREKLIRHQRGRLGWLEAVRRSKDPDAGREDAAWPVN